SRASHTHRTRTGESSEAASPLIDARHRSLARAGIATQRWVTRCTPVEGFLGKKIVMAIAAMIVVAASSGCAHTAIRSARSSPPIAATTTPSASQPARIVRRGDPQRRTVALTFDVGNDSVARAVEQILATLRSERVRASFAVTGLWAEQNHALILAITSDGDQLINGTYDGASFTGASTGMPLLTAAERSLELQ